MAELTTAVNELLKGKNVQENLHTYTQGLASLYKRMAYLRLSMNYYTFSEIYSELNSGMKNMILEEKTELQALIKSVIIDKKNSQDINLGAVKALRDRIINKMEILTGYVDRLQIIEYMLNRVEFKYKDSGFNNNYYFDKFEKDIFHYVTNDKDNSVINMKIAQVVSQVPMRLSKNKFFDILKDSLSLYKGSDIGAVNDFCYMIRTAGTLYTPKGMDKEFPELRDSFEMMCKTELDSMDEAAFDRMRTELDDAANAVGEYSDAFVMIAEVVNDIYSIILTLDSLSDINEEERLTDIIRQSYDVIEEKCESDPEWAAKFTEFEGLQEKLSSMIFTPESTIEEIRDINRAAIADFSYEEAFKMLGIVGRLQSASTFAKLTDDEDDSKEADEKYIASVLSDLTNEFSALFEENNQMYKRAVMASVLGNLPVFFNNLDEFKEYVHVALTQCRDNAEREACMSLINYMITSE